MQSLGDDFQLLVTSQPTPLKGFACFTVDRIPNRLANPGFNLNQFWVSWLSAYFKKGASPSVGSVLGTFGNPPRSALICLPNWVS